MSVDTKKEPEEQTKEYGSGEQIPLKNKLWDLAQVFTRLGAIAFGGPAAHIAQIELEVVQRRQWLSREKLLDFLRFEFTDIII